MAEMRTWGLQSTCQDVGPLTGKRKRRDGVTSTAGDTEQGPFFGEPVPKRALSALGRLPDVVYFPSGKPVWATASTFSSPSWPSTAFTAGPGGSLRAFLKASGGLAGPPATDLLGLGRTCKMQFERGPARADQSSKKVQTGIEQRHSWYGKHPDASHQEDSESFLSQGRALLARCVHSLHQPGTYLKDRTDGGWMEKALVAQSAELKRHKKELTDLRQRHNSLSHQMEALRSKDKYPGTDDPTGRDRYQQLLKETASQIGKTSQSARPSSQDNTVLTRESGLKKGVQNIAAEKERTAPPPLTDWQKRLQYFQGRASEAAARAREVEANALKAKLEALSLQKRDAIGRIKGDLEEEEAEESEEEDEAAVPLAEEAEDAVDEALGPGPGNEVLVMHEGSNIEVTRAYMKCLQPGGWLNDEVINLYMDLLKERQQRDVDASPGGYAFCHFFNTFFYNKLRLDKMAYDYKSVRRWTTLKKVGHSILDCDKPEECDVLIVPVHQGVHWCLAVVNLREHRLEYYDSMQTPDGRCPAIVIDPELVLEDLARYVMDEAADKKWGELDTSDWEHVLPSSIPQQNNGCDCGMFMVKFADYASRDAEFTFSQAHMGYFRRRLVWEILQLRAG